MDVGSAVGVGTGVLVAVGATVGFGGIGDGVLVGVEVAVDSGVGALSTTGVFVASGATVAVAGSSVASEVGVGVSLTGSGVEVSGTEGSGVAVSGGGTVANGPRWGCGGWVGLGVGWTPISGSRLFAHNAARTIATTMTAMAIPAIKV